MWKWIKALNPFAVQLRNAEARLEFARVLLAQAEIELADKAFYVREFAAVSAERDALKAEIAQHIAWQEAMVMDIAHVRAERDAFRAKLQRVTDHKQTITEGYKAEIAALRERASVPVKVRWGGDTYDYDRLAEELSNGNQWCWNGMMVEHAFKAFASHAVIDAPVGVPSVDPTTDQVEALARVLEDATAEGFEEEHRTYMRRLARAAIAHLSTRPEGLPTAEELAKVARNTWHKLSATHSRLRWEDAPELDKQRFSACAEAILAALRPWLRDPAGWELDVTEQAIRNAWLDGEAVGNSWDAARKVIDLCRSRIEPVYECKECVGKDAKLRALDKAIADLATRAALEGE
jgi:hypothetical protein